MLRCAQNIARWWLVEHGERERGSDSISYPGEVAMQQGLMPITLWLGVREYGGIWRHGGGDGQYEGQEWLGFLGDNRMMALSDAMTVYSINHAAGLVLQPTWYCDCFVEWAEEIAGMLVMPDVTNHMSIIRSNWCGRSGCLYPFITQHIFTPTAEYPG